MNLKMNNDADESFMSSISMLGHRKFHAGPLVPKSVSPIQFQHGLYHEEEVARMIDLKTETNVSHLTTSIASNLEKLAPNHFVIPETNIGYQILVKTGWNPSQGLGTHAQGKLSPVATQFKTGTQGLGLVTTRPKVTHFPAQKDDGAPTLAAMAAIDDMSRKRARKLGRVASQNTRVSEMMHGNNKIKKRVQEKRINSLEKAVDALIRHSLKGL